MPRFSMRQALSFAHLLGHAGQNARAEDTDDEQNDKPQGRRADNDQPDDDDAEPKSRKAQGGADDNNPDDDDTEPKGRKAKGGRADDGNPDDEDDEPKGRRTAAEDDDEEEREAEEDDADPKARAARKRERARCAAIFGSQHAAGRVASAAHLAFNTKMSSAQAIGVLQTLPKEQASAGGGLGARMQGYGGHRPSAATPPAPNHRETASASWDRAFAKAGIQTKR